MLIHFLLHCLALIATFWRTFGENMGMNVCREEKKLGNIGIKQVFFVETNKFVEKNMPNSCYIFW